MGYISSSYSVACGNGLLYSESFSVGIGHVAVHLMNELDIPYEVASYFLGKVNLNAKEKLTTIEEYKFEGKNYSFSTVSLRDLIREGLDGICETIEECRQSYTGKDISGKPLLITGEGIKMIRGAAEHISSRLVTSVEVIAPKLPYYDKPQFSSLFSLLSAALSER
jgi:cell division ATPase FtsA